VHLRVAGFVFVLGGVWGWYQVGIDGDAGFVQQTVLGQEFIDGEQYLLSQFVFFQTMPKPNSWPVKSLS
jgi:hypothetical protein